MDGYSHAKIQLIHFFIRNYMLLKTKKIEVLHYGCNSKNQRNYY